MAYGFDIFQFGSRRKSMIRRNHSDRTIRPGLVLGERTLMLYPVLQNQVFPTQREASKVQTAVISLDLDGTHGFVKNSKFDPKLMAYQEGYDNNQTFSDSFLGHLSKIADVIYKAFPKSKVIEIGCGNGDFLDLLEQRGMDITGFDPASSRRKWNINRRLFIPGEEEADLFVLRHVLEHIPNPFAFLSELAESHPDAKVFIEVPDLEWIIRNHAWFDFSYEHVNYFDKWSLSNFFRSEGKVRSVFNHQYITVLGDLSDLCAEPPLEQESRRAVLEDARECFELSMTPLSYDFGERSIVIWGAGSKGILFSILCTITGLNLKCMVDQNPNKQGRYAPLSGTEIMSPGDFKETINNEDVVVIANSSYEFEIVNQLPDHQEVVLLEKVWC